MGGESLNKAQRANDASSIQGGLVDEGGLWLWNRFVVCKFVYHLHDDIFAWKTKTPFPNLTHWHKSKVLVDNYDQGEKDVPLELDYKISLNIHSHQNRYFRSIFTDCIGKGMGMRHETRQGQMQRRSDNGNHGGLK